MLSEHTATAGGGLRLQGLGLWSVLRNQTLAKQALCQVSVTSAIELHLNVFFQLGSAGPAPRTWPPNAKSGGSTSVSDTIVPAGYILMLMRYHKIYGG